MKILYVGLLLSAALCAEAHPGRTADKRSSLDSLQQALFFSALTGKAPAVVIYDTDGKGRFEYRIRAACEKAGVQYEVFR